MEIERNANDMYLNRLPRHQANPKLSFSQKFWKIVQSIIDYIKSFFTRNPFQPTLEEMVTARDIKIMQGQIKAEPVRPQLPNPVHMQPQGRQEMEAINLQLSVARPDVGQHDFFAFQEDYLNHTAQEVVRIASDSADLIYQREVAQIIALVQQGSKGIPELLKTIAGVVLKLGQAANKHYGTLIDKHEMSGIINNELGFLLNWLSLNDFTNDRNERIQYKNQLYAKVRSRLITDIRAEMKGYLDPTLQWLLQTDHQAPFKDAFSGFDPYNEELSKETLGAAVQILIEFKIDLYAQYVNGILQNNLPQIVQIYLRENLAKMAAHEEIRHVLGVIKDLPWSSLIDGAIEIIHDHITAYINGVKAKDTYVKTQNADRGLQERITLYKARIEADPVGEDEIRLQEQARIDLARIEEEQERLKENSFWSAYSNTQKTQLEYVVHPTIRALADAKIKQSDVENVEGKANHEYFGQLADQILDILLPGDKTNIDSWLDKLTVPHQFKEIIAHTKQIAREVISPAMLGIISLPPAWQNKILDEAANIIVMEIKKWLKEILMRSLYDKLTQYADPDEIDEIMADQVLPDVIIPQLIQTAAKHVLFLDIEGYSQEFTNLVAINRVNSLAAIQTRLFQTTQTLLPHVPFPAIQMSQAKFNEAIKPFLQELEGRLQRVREQDFASFTHEKVVILLAKYFADDDAVEDSRPVYGKLVTDLISEMSTAGGWAKWGVKKGEQALSKILVTSMRDVRISPEFTVKLLSETISKLMAKDKLPELYFGAPGQNRQQIRQSLVELESRLERAEANPHPSVDDEAQLVRLRAEHVNHRLVRSRNKLTANIQVLSNITYDVAMAKIHHLGKTMTKDYSFGFLSGLGASVATYVGAGVIGTPEQLNEMVTDLYSKLVGNAHRNQSLINQVMALFMRKASETSRRIRQNVPIAREIVQV